MKRCLFLGAMVIALVFALEAYAVPAGSAFTYQGRLEQGGEPVTGLFSFRFSLWDAAAGGAQVGTSVEATNVAIEDGYFTTTLDFGTAAFDGSARWLEIEVLNAANVYVTLSPRQPVTAAPYAIRSLIDEVGGGGGEDLEARVAALETQVAELTALLAGVRREPQTIVLDGLNLQIVNGTGTTNGTPNGLGNLIIGYNELPKDPRDRSGSHNAVIGMYHGYGAHSGIVAGYDNQILAQGACVTGGLGNVADGEHTSVAGGCGNNAEGYAAMVAGGGGPGDSDGNRARARYAAILGGWRNVAGSYKTDDETIGMYSTVSGGRANAAVGLSSTVSGGHSNYALGENAAVSGGESNQADGESASCTGGTRNFSSGRCSTVTGGAANTATGLAAAVVGGGGADAAEANEAQADYSAILGGQRNITYQMVDDAEVGLAATISGGRGGATFGPCASVTGGFENQATGEQATVSGGAANVATGPFSSVSGGSSNQAAGMMSSVTGGQESHASGENSSVTGGQNNNATGKWTIVCGGYDNEAYARNSAILGGEGHLIGKPGSDFAGVVGESGAISGGLRNVVEGDYGSVSGGHYNSAIGWYASVTGGWANRATGEYASISGGADSLAEGGYSSVSGGEGNIARGPKASILGGNGALAEGGHATISGGAFSRATGSFASVVGGQFNQATGHSAVAVGGKNNEAKGYASCTVGGGGSPRAMGNIAFGRHSVVVGGRRNIAGDNTLIDPDLGDAATVLGGEFNRATGFCSAVTGGLAHTAAGDYVLKAMPTPDYDSGWVSVERGRSATLTHNLGGNLNNYVIQMECFDLGSYDGNQLYHRQSYGGRADIRSFFGAVVGNYRRGAYWHGLSNTEIKVHRERNDWNSPRVRIRIWVQGEKGAL